ncbi:hypothetical protein MHU86_8142 [Fragilaria crotonensis]|nr:hypothetical protein MHU86_8142 [Fragilaria crotonensis]
MSSRSSEHVKSNDARLGLQIASRHVKTSKVIGIQCRFCMVFGREERSGTKRKARTAVKGWSAPFRYDNIEIHMRQQHAVHFERYERLDRKDKDAREEFFRDRENYDSSTGTGCPPSKDITIKSHFPSLSPNTKPIIFTIAKKDIVDVIVGDMFFDPADDAEDTIDDDDNADGSNGSNSTAFGSERELNASKRKRQKTAATAKTSSQIVQASW